MANFDFLKKDPQFSAFADAGIVPENQIQLQDDNATFLD